MKLWSPSFEDGHPIPIQYTCDASEFSPALEWAEPPQGSKSYAVICEAPDAPEGPAVHWLIYGIPDPAFMLAPKMPTTAEHPSGLKQGVNSFGKIGFTGPCPPEGSELTYVFTVYALDVVPEVSPEATRDELLAAMDGHVLATAATTCTYKR